MFVQQQTTDWIPQDGWPTPLGRSSDLRVRSYILHRECLKAAWLCFILAIKWLFSAGIF